MLGILLLADGNAQVLERLAKELAMRLNFNGHFSEHVL